MFLLKSVGQGDKAAVLRGFNLYDIFTVFTTVFSVFITVFITVRSIEDTKMMRALEKVGI